MITSVVDKAAFREILGQVVYCKVFAENFQVDPLFCRCEIPFKVHVHGK